MKRLCAPTTGPCQWQNLLADPEKQWKRGRSAFEMAISWEAAQNPERGSGLPPEVSEALNAADCTKNCCLLVALPEHRVPLDKGTRFQPKDDLLRFLDGL
jgi:hypothetical protein